MARRWVTVLAALVIPAAATAQEIQWQNRFTLYGDNTEFFTPYRVGETILGGQFTSSLWFKTGKRTGILAGVFGDRRSGSNDFLDQVKPILSFRYRTATSLGVLGTLETVDRHGLLEPLEVTTLELTRPIEYGLQWKEDRKHWDVDAFLNWQAVNRPNQREVFDYGWRLRLRPVRWLSLESQLHGVHHGGQLYDAGVPVTNNLVAGFGVGVSDSFPIIGRSSLLFYRLQSSGNIDPNAPASRPKEGHGYYLRAGVTPGNWFELFTIFWNGRDFLSQEGDNNYNSVGADPTYYRSRRTYREIGIVRRTEIESRVTLDAEFRLHHIDDNSSIAFFRTSWEYSYRLVVRAPFDVRLFTRRL